MDERQPGRRWPPQDQDLGEGERAEASAGTRDESERGTHKVGKNVTGIRRNNLHEPKSGLL